MSGMQKRWANFESNSHRSDGIEVINNFNTLALYCFSLKFHLASTLLETATDDVGSASLRSKSQSQRMQLWLMMMLEWEIFS